MERTLKDFITSVILDCGKDLELLNGAIKHVKNQAEILAENGCACVDDETVKAWVIKYLENPVKQEKKAVEKPKKVKAKEEKPKIEEKAEEHSQFESIKGEQTTFDLGVV